MPCLVCVRPSPAQQYGGMMTGGRTRKPQNRFHTNSLCPPSPRCPRNRRFGRTVPRATGHPPSVGEPRAVPYSTENEDARSVLPEFVVGAFAFVFWSPVRGSVLHDNITSS